jgi:hypothetical protein
MSEQKHTATPYEAQYIEIGGEKMEQLCIISIKECREVATIDRIYNGERDKDAEKATAEFIVRACNAHDDLVRALQSVVENWTAQCERNGHLAPQWVKDARAALAKAQA